MLTATQRKALDYIIAYQRENDGMSPTFREISTAVGNSRPEPGSGHRILDCLEDRGFIKRKRGRQRCITVLKRWCPHNRQATFVWHDQLKALIPWDGRKREEAGSACDAPASN